jgi:hypothetical protein
MMHDSVATFYGGYDQVGLLRPRRFHVPWIYFGIGVAAITLVGVVAADVAAFTSGGAVVQVTAVDWYVEGSLLASTGGFSVHTSQDVQTTLTCSTVCFRITGAAVSPPFQFVSFSVSYSPIQYVNVTAKAPPAAYSGPLVINLEIP